MPPLSSSDWTGQQCRHLADWRLLNCPISSFLLAGSCLLLSDAVDHLSIAQRGSAVIWLIADC